jgi:glycosyltransferase involved in cell wall biosynthesis
MVQPGYPADLRTRESFARVERDAITLARRSTFTTRGCVRVYGERYPEHADRLRLLENGYDEATFAGIAESREPLTPGRLTLLHSGVVYPSERDPTELFAALAGLRDRLPAVFERLIVRFRAAVHTDTLHELVRRYRVESAVEILPGLSHREATEEMCRADALLILQANNCNEQIPAKFYEYLRARRPILALADPRGDTGEAAFAAGIGAVVALEDRAGIATLLERFVSDQTEGTIASVDAIDGASRKARTAELAALLDEVMSNAR